MNKAILVIDMPDSCSECKFLNDNYDYSECIITGETMGYTFRAREQKMDKCPLKPVPKLVKVMYGDDSQDYDEGYNACVEEILDI